MKRPTPRLAILLAILLPTASRAPAQTPAPHGLEIVTATWKVAGSPDVDVTSILAGMVKDGQLELRVSANAMHITPPRQGLVGSLTVTYKLDGGDPQTKTTRGGGTLLRLSAKPADTPDVVQADPPHVPLDNAAVAKLPIVQFTAQEPLDATNGSANGSLLVRELQRQALWLAATEQLGLRTRDMALEPALGTDTPGNRTTLLVGTRFRRAFALDTTLALPGGPTATDPLTYAQVDLAKYTQQSPDKLLAAVHKQLPNSPWFDYALIIKTSEAQSRHELVDGYKKSKRPGHRIPPPAKLGHRSRHPLPHRHPATPAHEPGRPVRRPPPPPRTNSPIRRLARNSSEMPVQGYANLAFMTSPLYSGIYKTYMARSLLYAERLVVHSHADAHSLYTRAYARGMAGLATLALDDLATARKKETTDTPPAWAAIIDASCHYDLKAMQSAATTPGPYQPLAQMLALNIAIDGHGSQAIADAGSACLTTQSQNLWAMQQLFQNTPFGMQDNMPATMPSANPSCTPPRHSISPKTPGRSGTPA